MSAILRVVSMSILALLLLAIMPLISHRIATTPTYDYMSAKQARRMIFKAIERDFVTRYAKEVYDEERRHSRRYGSKGKQSRVGLP